MNIDQELGQLPTDRESVLTIGVFDGVHLGHRHIISSLIEEAKRTRRLAGVVTFRNHPASVLQSDFEPRYLTAVDERLRLLKALGVDFVAPVSFDLELSKVSAGRFAALLQRHLRMAGLVIGPDFAMGHDREGGREFLERLGREMGFSVSVVEPRADQEGRPLRSTGVREALAAGDVELAAALLGRDFVLDGTVVTGQGRGGPLGFPTANLKVPEGMAVPGDGIYATWAHIGGGRHMAATSIGVRPTFEETERTTEAFIMDFRGDLYGQTIQLEFVRRLRDEARFDSVQALQEQVCKDVDQARAILASYVGRQ